MDNTSGTSRYIEQQIPRRQFLAGAVALGGVAALGSSLRHVPQSAARRAGAAVPNYGTLTYRLSWIENAQFAGVYIADSYGYYRQQGFSSVVLIPGGPTAAPIESTVATGHAFVAPSQPDLTSTAIMHGAKVKIIGAQYQKNPNAILSLGRKPIPEPKAMIGKKIGVQPSNQILWNAFLAANKISPSQVDVVPVQFDLTPLTSGQVDGWFAFYNNEPIELQVKGYKTVTFLLADWGYPLSSQTYIVTTSTLANHRDMIKAWFKAEIMGWKRAFANPGLGAKLDVTNYGKTLGLDLHEETLEVVATKSLAISPDTQKNGLFTMTPELVAKNIDTLARSGIKISAKTLFDLSVIEEVYQENPSLR